MKECKVININSTKDTSYTVEEYTDSDLTDCIVKLHEIARTVEKTLGSGALSERIRYSADILSELLKKV